MADDDLVDFDRSTFTHQGRTHAVFRCGQGPAVIVIAEMPGITPKVADFARRVAAIGCTAVVPQLFGHPGRDPHPLAHGRLASVAYLMSSLASVCVQREFVILATGRTSPIVAWLKALGRHEHRCCGGPGVGAVGMCFSGGFALAMAADETVLASVVAQPSLPLALTKRQRHTIDIADEDLAIVKRRCAQGLPVLGLRFASDRFVPAERFAYLREQLGTAFVAVELRDEDANPAATMAPHSVLTEHLIDEPGRATRSALDDVLQLFRTHLQPASAIPVTGSPK